MSLLLDRARPLVIQSSTSAAAGLTTSYFGMKNVDRATILIPAVTIAGATGAAVGLVQATSAAGGGIKTLAFSRYQYNLDNTTDSYTNVTNATSSFTTAATASKSAYYAIDIDPASLDVANTFGYVGVTFGANSNTTVGVIALLEKRSMDGATEPATI